MRKRKVLAWIIVLTLILSSLTVAYSTTDEFNDMPDNWSTKALENAVENGLLNGADGQIMPDANLTRAQMATVINRAFGAQVKGNIQSFTDVPVGAWYYDEMAKAVQMKTFQGSGNRLDPEDPITREQAFIVMARALKLEKNNQEPEGFADLEDISSWAKDEVFSLIEAGYVQGSNGRINPKSTMTRAEFAQLMDNLIKLYIREAGEYTEVPEGNIMINVPDVTMKNVKITGDLILGDGVGDGDITLDGVEITGRLLVRGGGEDTIIIKGDSKIQKIIIARVDGVVRVFNETGKEIGEVIVDGSDDVILEGQFGQIVLLADNVDVYALKATFSDSNITGDNSKIVQPVVVESTRQSIRSVSIEGDTDLMDTTLSAVVMPSQATVSYRWLISDTAEGEFVAIEGETSDTYEITSDDIGKFIKVEARGTGDYRNTRNSEVAVIGFGGFNTSKNAYEVANWYHLDNIRYILDGNFVMTANIGAPEEVGDYLAPSIVYETKGYDEVLGNGGFEPIGRPVLIGPVSVFDQSEDDLLSQLFTGTFDGEGHIIKDLYVNQDRRITAQVSDLSNATGLFSIAYQAELKNLMIKDSEVWGTDFVGALVGYSRESMISNVHNISDFQWFQDIAPIGVVVGRTYVGGITGINDSGVVTNSSNGFIVLGEEIVGGVAGINHFDGMAVDVMTIQGAPVLDAQIMDSWNEGIVIGHQQVGGVVGRNGRARYYASLDEVEALRLVGEMSSYINNCYNTGFVIPINHMSLITQSSMNLGGIVGYNEGTVSESYNAGDVGYQPDSLVGLDEAMISEDTLTSERVGGLVGSDFNGKILNSYNKGAIYGLEDIGGIVGYAEYSEITNNYNIGDIDRKVDDDLIKGVSDIQSIYGGEVDAYFAGNYFQLESLGPRTVDVMKRDDGIYPRTLEELRNPLNYVPGVFYRGEEENSSWNFDEIWFMDLQTNDGLPILRWEDEMFETATSLSVTIPTYTLTYGESTSQAAIAIEGEVEVDGQPLDGEFIILDDISWFEPGFYDGIRISFVPEDCDYRVFYGYSKVMVSKADPSVVWPETIYAFKDEVITEDHFTGESSTPSGIFTITDATTSWASVGTYSLEVTFTPDDSNYKTVSNQIDVVVMEELTFERIEVKRSSDEIDLLFSGIVNQKDALEKDDFTIRVTNGEGETEVEIDEIIYPTGEFDFFTIRCVNDSLTTNSVILVTIEPSGAAKLMGQGDQLLSTDVLTRVWGIVYEENFEADNGGFTHSGTPNNVWQWGTPSTWPNETASGQKCWGTNLAGDYPNNAEVTLLSPEIDLTYISTDMPINIQWMQAWHIENSNWDQANAQYTIDGGSTWISIWEHSGATNPMPWQLLGYDISDSAGQTVQFRWVLKTDFSITYPGVYIDDIIIEVGNDDFISLEIDYPVSNEGMEKEVRSE